METSDRSNKKCCVTGARNQKLKFKTSFWLMPLRFPTSLIVLTEKVICPKYITNTRFSKIDKNHDFPDALDKTKFC